MSRLMSVALTELWLLDRKRFTADSRLLLAHEEAAGHARAVAEDALLIEDGIEAAAERMLRVFLSEKPAARSEGAYRMLMLRLLDAAARRESR